MSTPRLLRWPDPRLSIPADPVDQITPDVHAIWDQMIEIMEAMPGVGLAAPQIGISLRLAVVDASTERGKVIRLANPTIIEASDEMRRHDEASPNLPGVSAMVARPASVTVGFMNAAGEHEVRTFSDLWSTSVQHQIDHLNGQLYVSRVSKVRRDMLLRKSRKFR